MSILVTMTEQKRLEIGDQAPAFTLPNDSGETTSLADYQGKRVLVYFYPRANTPGCTTEACDFRDSLTQLNDLGIEVVGISPDTVDKLVAFREKNNLTFPLLADPDKNVLKEWGAFGEKKNYGKIVEGVIRSTFLVGTDGTIELALYNVRATGHVARVIRELEK
ncbi:putative peroxiredoxin bcp [Corynebacterium durum F0235]|uniref:thioredoxin-dependent peroxiredoxin n=2 Tax=Corynebacterium durum TaxID=61592 RepID=L1MJP8_9CORY|nr:putative peroxiredoxin bcp [Corynebacterium durum F0235]